MTTLEMGGNSSRIIIRQEEPAQASGLNRVAYVRDFLAITAFFGTMYAWFVVGSALTQ